MRVATLLVTIFVVGPWAGAQTPAGGVDTVSPRQPVRTAPSSKEGNKNMARPLEGLAGQHIMVLPVQYVTFADSLGWNDSAPPVRMYRQTLDDEITFALRERGLQGWILPDAVTRSALRNAGFAADPRALQASQVRIGVKNKAFQLSEPLASQLRSLIALNDARYVLFPVEVRFTGANGVGHATLHVVVVDARGSQIQWAGDLTGMPSRTFSPALAADLASRLADLIAPAH